MLKNLNSAKKIKSTSTSYSPCFGFFSFTEFCFGGVKKLFAALLIPFIIGEIFSLAVVAGSLFDKFFKISLGVTPLEFAFGVLDKSPFALFPKLDIVFNHEKNP